MRPARAASTASIVPVSAGEGREPRWAKDGRELYYRSGEDLVAIHVAGQKEPVVGAPERIATLPDVRSYYVGPGRRQFGALQRVPGAGIQTKILLVTHWFKELGRRVPARAAR